MRYYVNFLGCYFFLCSPFVTDLVARASNCNFQQFQFAGSCLISQELFLSRPFNVANCYYNNTNDIEKMKANIQK